MKKIGDFIKKHKTFFIVAIILLVVAGGIGIGLDQKEKHKWKKHPVEPYSYEFVENDDISTIKARILDDKKDAELDVTEVLAKAKADGTFEGINYDGLDKSYWQPLDHLKNVLKLQIAYYSEGNAHYNDPVVKEVVTKAMNNWIDNEYTCTWNWWNNDIGVGQYMPDILLFGVDGVSDESQKKLLNNLKGIQLQNEKMFNGCVSRKVNSSGGNLTDKAISTMKVAILQNDGSTLMWVKSLLERELHPFPSYEPGMFRDDCEGIKEDGSFQQHYQLIYFGGYGEVFADGINKYVELTSNTQYALNDEALNLYADFLLDGMQYVTRNGYRDISASGRGAVRTNGLKGIASQIKKGAMVLLNEKNIERADELKAMLDNRFLSEVDAGANGHKYYYESDFQVMNNNNYMASVRSASERTRIYEYLNGENPLAYYTGLGATFYYVKGDEYYNVLPLYDWTKVPGTTVRQDFEIKKDEGFSYSTYGVDNTVGGVSNGKLGASFIGLKDNGVKGNKAYFMFDDAVVCLGNSLSNKNAENLYTTIDQANLKGDIVLNDGTKLGVGDSVNGKYSYVYHNGISYITDDEIEVSAEHIKGDWKTVNERKKETPIEGDKYTIAIPHNSKENVSYAYTVLLNTTAEDSENYLANPRYEVVSNTAEVQAVLDTKTGTLQAVFHKAGELSYGDGKTVKASKACLVIVESVDSKDVVTVSSYDGKQRNIEFTVNGKATKQAVTKKSTVLA